MGRKSRDKGAAFEREIAVWLSAALGLDVKRRLGQARDSGHDLDAFPFRVECKRRKSLGPVQDWYDQVNLANRPPTDVIGREALSVVICRGDGREPLAVLSLTDLLRVHGGYPPREL